MQNLVVPQGNRGIHLYSTIVNTLRWYENYGYPALDRAQSFLQGKGNDYIKEKKFKTVFNWIKTITQFCTFPPYSRNSPKKAMYNKIKDTVLLKSSIL